MGRKEIHILAVKQHESLLTYWAPGRWYLLLGRVRVAFVEHQISFKLLILLTLFYLLPNIHFHENSGFWGLRPVNVAFALLIFILVFFIRENRAKYYFHKLFGGSSVPYLNIVQ
jgi:hypothetical protein